MNIREGDVYRWYYKNDQEYRDQQQMAVEILVWAAKESIK